MRFDSKQIDRIQHSFNYVIDIAIGHFRVDRERNHPQILTVSDWEILWHIAISVPIVGMDVEGDKVDADSNILLFEVCDNGGSIDRPMI